MVHCRAAPLFKCLRLTQGLTVLFAENALTLFFLFFYRQLQKIKLLKIWSFYSSRTVEKVKKQREKKISWPLFYFPKLLKIVCNDCVHGFLIPCPLNVIPYPLNAIGSYRKSSCPKNLYSLLLNNWTNSKQKKKKQTKKKEIEKRK